jgi:hypothetical protein
VLVVLALLQEACRNDRASLPLLQRLRRLVRLAVGLSPSASSSSGGGAYPCTLAGELLDGTRQAAAAITGGSSSSREAGAGSRGGAAGGRARAGGRGGERLRSAAGAAGASTVDPDSPGAAAALLAGWGCSPLLLMADLLLCRANTLAVGG